MNLSMRCRLASAWTLGTIAVLAIYSSGCGSDSGDRELPANAAARVGDTVITKRQLRALVPAAEHASQQRVATGYLILVEWMRQEARRKGIAIPAHGEGEPRATAEAKLLVERLRGNVADGRPSEREIERYYLAHPLTYRTPQVRYMKLVATDSRERAMAARRALQQGRGWGAVIARYSAHDRSPTPPSGDMGAVPGEMPAALDEALFAARRGAFYGPARTSEAWYVFELLRSVRRGPGQSLDEARDAIADSLEARRARRHSRELLERLETRYRPITFCSRRLLVPECRNGPAGPSAAVALLAL